MEDRSHCKCGTNWKLHTVDHNQRSYDEGQAAFAAYISELLSQNKIGHARVPSSRSQRVGIEATSEVLCPDDEEQSGKDKLRKKKDHAKFVGEIPDDGPRVRACLLYTSPSPRDS